MQALTHFLNSVRTRGLLETTIQELHDALEGLSIDFPETTFIDLGAGKGRALFIASRFAFREIVGVDFSPELIELARGNISLFSARHSHPPILLRCMDAREYSFPHGQLCIYMFNPFDAAVMGPVMDNLQRGLKEGTIERVTLIYVNPIESQLVSRYLKVVKRVRQPGVSSYEIFSSFCLDLARSGGATPNRAG